MGCKTQDKKDESPQNCLLSKHSRRAHGFRMFQCWCVVCEVVCALVRESPSKRGMCLASLQQQPCSPSSSDSRPTPTTSIPMSFHEEEDALSAPTATIPTSTHEDHGALSVAVYTQLLYLEALMGVVDANYTKFLEGHKSSIYIDSSEDYEGGGSIEGGMLKSSSDGPSRCSLHPHRG